MNELLVLAGAALALASGMPGLALRRGGRAGERLATALLVAAAACGITGAVRALAWPATAAPQAIAWTGPGGHLGVVLDPLAAMFILPIFALGALGAIYGLAYWPQREHPHDGRKLRASYGAIVAGMATLVVAADAMVFLLGWEVMAIAAFLAITTEDEQASVREVGYVYLAATRLATLGVIATFTLLFVDGGTWDLTGGRDASTSIAAATFVVALFGFGVKAGLMPLHVWLPGAHANAPSHVSAVMSGVLIKMGVYGLLRVTSLYPSPPLWWGLTVLALGALSGVLGVAFALGQHDLKRLLAYHSVENIGIILLGVGVALVGRSTGRGELVALGMAGALLHTWNHGLFKGLLFLAAGSVIHATGTRELDRLGGLLRPMPRTAFWFLVGAVAICGLPPLNGFISELFVYVGLVRLSTDATTSLWLAGAGAAALLALIGALAVACFVKVTGVVFLGEPRTDAPAHAHEAPRAMRGPMATLGALCFAIGLGALALAPALDRAAAAWAPEAATPATAELAPLAKVALVYVALLAVIALVGLWLVRRVRAGTSTRTSAPPVPTWDCGYAAPTARMQYTASSFASVIVRMFAPVLRPHVARPAPAPAFPAAARFASHVDDTILDGAIIPAGRAAARWLPWVRQVQRGSAHAYVLYIIVALVVLLAWKGG